MLERLRHPAPQRSDRRGKKMFLRTAWIWTALAAIASASPPPEDFYAFVTDYLPEGYVTDGSVDYKQQIQKCLDENLSVFFPGSDDPDRPLVYGVTGETVGKVLRTRPHAHIRFGPNAVLKRLPSFGKLIHLAPGAQLTGAVIDGNKYAHWPLVKDREVKPYAFSIGHAVVLGGRNVLKDCFVYDNAGIAFGAWSTSDNKFYRCRVENCGFLEAIGMKDYWGAEVASGDGFYSDRGRFNLVKDSEAYDCSRWGYVVTAGARDSTIVDCRGGNLHFACYGFLDVEGAGPGNSLIRCRSPNSDIGIQGYFQDAVGCTAKRIYAEAASYPRMIGCTTTGGWLRLGEVRDDRLVTPGRASPMLGFSRVFLGGPSADHSLTVIGSDGRGIVENNVLYGFDDGKKQSVGMFLYGVAGRSGNIEASGNWKRQIDQFAKPYFLRARVDFDFKKRFAGPKQEE